VVYIADEIPPDSCGFHEVMAHEQKHLNVNQHLLQEAIPKIEQQFLEHIRQRGVYHSIDPMLPRNDMQEFLASVMNSFDTENVQRQQRVDSPEEYHRVSVSCNGQLAIISQHYRLTGQ